MQGVLYKSRDGQERSAKAHLTIVCDGMYSNLRSKLSQPKIKHPSFFVGLLLKGCSLPHANFGHVVLAKPSPILFYPISSEEVSPASKLPGIHSSCLSPNGVFDCYPAQEVKPLASIFHLGIIMY